MINTIIIILHIYIWKHFFKLGFISLLTVNIQAGTIERSSSWEFCDVFNQGYTYGKPEVKGQINKLLCTQDICVEKCYVSLSHHISL